MSLPVSTEDVYAGKVVEASFNKLTACKKCQGTGAESPKSLYVCSKCGGNGFSIAEGVNYFGQKYVN
jgi:DnaJ-class molecular chaperone